jgi:hypothetical protein
LLPPPDSAYFTYLFFIFFKYVLIFQGDFTLVFQTCIYCALIRLTILHYLLFLYCPAPLLFHSLQCIALHYLHTQMKCFTSIFFFYQINI